MNPTSNFLFAHDFNICSLLCWHFGFGGQYNCGSLALEAKTLAWDEDVKKMKRRIRYRPCKIESVVEISNKGAWNYWIYKCRKWHQCIITVTEKDFHVSYKVAGIIWVHTIYHSHVFDLEKMKSWRMLMKNLNQTYEYCGAGGQIPSGNSLVQRDKISTRWCLCFMAPETWVWPELTRHHVFVKWEKIRTGRWNLHDHSNTNRPAALSLSAKFIILN